MWQCHTCVNSPWSSRPILQHANCVTPWQREVLTFGYFALWDVFVFNNKGGCAIVAPECVKIVCTGLSTSFMTTLVLQKSFSITPGRENDRSQLPYPFGPHHFRSPSNQVQTPETRHCQTSLLINPNILSALLLHPCQI